MTDDAQLLSRYAAEKSEPAFAALVQRHLDFVYGCALRRLGGDVHLTQDVVQQVFVVLARQAAALVRHPALSAWLFTTTRNIAADTVRRDRRRRRREQEAELMRDIASPDGPPPDWGQLRPALDHAMGELSERDRQAVLLRFFEGRSFAEVGARLRLNENAARMRVERALDKMHALLARRGVTSTTAALALALANQSAIAAPAGMANLVVSTALAGAATAGPAVGGIAGAAASLSAFFGVGKAALVVGTVTLATAVGVIGVAASRAQASHAELAVVIRERAELQEKLVAVQRDLADAEAQDRAADAEVVALLKTVQSASPAVEAPPVDAVCLAFVIDSSGSMRDPKSGRLWQSVSDVIGRTLAAHPEAAFVLGLDANGRTIFSAGDRWLPRTADVLPAIEQAVASYEPDNFSNPVPGLYRAMRGLEARATTGPKLHVCVIGDELNLTDQPESVLQRLDELDPADATGKRRATISAVQLPTTVPTPGGAMGNTGLRFQAIMTQVAKRHGGTYALLPERELH
jgi:RNA polymerase sigma factor (sigma-70 family)